MNSVKNSAVERITKTGDRIEGQPVRRGCFDAVFTRAKTLAVSDKFDFIYCAGRFDYLCGLMSKEILNLLSRGNLATSCWR